jgi:hypothetical protein
VESSDHVENKLHEIYFQRMPRMTASQRNLALARPMILSTYDEERMRELVGKSKSFVRRSLLIQQILLR